MNHDDLSPDCGRLRQELAGLLYGELAPDTRLTLEQHLEGCAACRDELAALRDTQKMLARWETPALDEDPRVLARSIAAAARLPSPVTARRARLIRWSARFAGAAAAVLVCFSLMHARVRFDQGRFELSFGLEPARATLPVQDGLAPDWRDELRRAVTQEVAHRTASFQEDQEALYLRCMQMTRKELLRLSQAVDYALVQNQERWGSSLDALGREAARADLETRRAVTDLASYLPELTASQPNR